MGHKGKTVGGLSLAALSVVLPWITGSPQLPVILLGGAFVLLAQEPLRQGFSRRWLLPPLAVALYGGAGDLLAHQVLRGDHFLIVGDAVGQFGLECSIVVAVATWWLCRPAARAQNSPSPVTTPVTSLPLPSEDVKFCRRCGAARAAGTRFCAACGFSYADAPPSTTVTSTKSTTSAGKLATVGSIAICLGLLSSFILAWNDGDPNPTIENIGKVSVGILLLGVIAVVAAAVQLRNRPRR
jgi:hypothetical protein